MFYWTVLHRYFVFCLLKRKLPTSCSNYFTKKKNAQSRMRSLEKKWNPLRADYISITISWALNVPISSNSATNLLRSYKQKFCYCLSEDAKWWKLTKEQILHDLKPFDSAAILISTYSIDFSSSFAKAICFNELTHMHRLLYNIASLIWNLRGNHKVLSAFTLLPWLFFSSGVFALGLF